VLRGIGGERVFLDRYRRRSEEVRLAGVRVALPQSTLDSAQVLLPGIFVVLVTWLGARLALEGRISAGELVAFYGYAAFLVIPLRVAAEAVDKITRALVGAQRMLAVLAIDPLVGEPRSAAEAPAEGVRLIDEQSGLVVEPGLFTCVVTRSTDEAARVADRLGRFADDGRVNLGETPIDTLPVVAIRRRVVVSETDPLLFSGPLRDEIDPWGRASEEQLLDAIAVANAEDVLDALPEGLDGHMEERGRSLSGGQRQRLVLTRALTLDPQILVLVEPTSAVDAHTEATIAKRLRRHRHGRTTVVTTASPLLLDTADEVALLEAGKVVATGRHRDLLDDPRYRRVVSRGEE
jgi:ABC-type bacteriocin/lantibiotic exporter with double-glycine peptidase domain